MTIFRKVMVADRLPKEGVGIFTDVGCLNYRNIEGDYVWSWQDEYTEHPTWWLEEIQLPTEEEIIKSSFEYSVDYKPFDSSLEFSHYAEHGYIEGALSVLNYIKNGGK